MISVSEGQFILLLSVLSMTAVATYELYRGPNWGTFLGGILGYIAVLPLFIMNAFDLTATIEKGLLVFGILSGVLGLTILVKTR